MKKIRFIVLSLIVLLIFTGCGKHVDLPTGSAASDISVLSEGRFSPIPVDTSFMYGDYYISDFCFYSDGYEYLLSSFDHRSLLYNDYYLKLDKDGQALVSTIISKPIYIEDGSVRFIDVARDVSDVIEFEYFDPKVSYSNLSFDEDGGFSAYCSVYYFYYSQLENYTDSVSSDYFIKWDTQGNCISVEKCSSEREYVPSENPGYILGFDGNKYKTTSSGIVLLDEEGNYASKYFDFLNSDIFSYGFDLVNIYDNDHFSAVYRDADFNIVFSCFVRNRDMVTSTNALVLACTGLGSDLKYDVYNFNSEGNGYRIAVTDFSDKSLTSNESEGWSILKDAMASGYRPDMILNTSGYDEAFLNEMASANGLVDIKEVIKKDETLKSLKFSDLANSFYYSDDKVYCVVPSYTYRSVIGSVDHYSVNDDFSYEGFLAYASPVAGSSNIFRNDTRDEFLDRFLAYNGYEFIDYDNNSSSFESGVFAGYLELAAKLPEDLESSFERVSYNGIENYNLSDIYCTNLGDYNLFCTLNSLGEYVDLGFPCGEGGGRGVISANESYMIVADRKYTNECWNFIKKYLSDEYQGMIYDGIPVTQYGYIVWKAYLYPYSADPTLATYFKDGKENVVANPDESKVNQILDAVKSCDRKEFSDYRVEQIVLEYAHLYFDGKITAEEAAAAIDMDVETYLAS